VLLVGAALWLASPYFSPVLIGTGDALWYHHLLADAVQQFRAGVFPVYVGQSEFMFNGAVYPHRVAPYHQYFAGLIDLLSGRSLGFFALQHLTIILSFVGGGLAAYGTLTRLNPEARWRAAALSFLYLACPGVMGLAFAQDLYMSVMTLPWVPLALGGSWLTFRENSGRAHAMAVAGIGALWWAHAPIAMWVCLLVGAQQTVRLIASADRREVLRRGALSMLALGALVAYPFASAFLLRAPGEQVVPYVMDRVLLLQEIRAVFPACLLPLNMQGSPLGQLQLGYALLISATAVVILTIRRPRAELIVASLALLLLVCLVLPVPGVNAPLWMAFPEPIVGLSLYWPMQRLYIVLAALTIIAVQLMPTPASWPRPARHAISAILVAGCLWSAAEARKFHAQATARAAANADAAKWALSENATPMRHAYHLFARQPTTMSHGVMDPSTESRLLDPESWQPLAAPRPAAPHPHLLTGTLDANPGILNLQPSLVIAPHQRQVLSFDFLEHDYTGILQIIGPGFFREYTLPSSGNARAFGTGRDAARTLTLWTSGDTSLEVSLRFIPTKPGVRADIFSPFARYRFEPRDETRQHVTVSSLIPFRATVRAPAACLLETPRMAVPGYAASVNGRPVAVHKSPEGFVTLPVPPGQSEVEVRFVGPGLLRATFGLSALAWGLLLPGVVVLGIMQRLR
jgi:hypothetical protein